MRYEATRYKKYGQKNPFSLSILKKLYLHLYLIFFMEYGYSR